MAKLPRVFQNLFGLNGDQSHFEQFGSKVVTGSPVFTKDPNSIQAGPAFIGNGWLDAIVAGNFTIFLEDMNALWLLIFRQIAYGFQEGIPEWDAGTTYFTGGIVKKTGTTELYGSLIDNNLNNALPNQTANANWNYLNPQSVAPGIISDFGGASAPFGYLLCDGTAYDRAAFPNLFAVIGTIWNTFNGNAAPSVTQFRVPDLRGTTTIGVGQGNLLTNRTLAQFIGEETHVLVVGEMPQHAHGVTDPGHVHAEIGTPGAATAGTISLVAFTTAQSRVIADNTQPATTGIAINNTGGNGAHNNMQPSAVVTKVIKT